MKKVRFFLLFFGFFLGCAHSGNRIPAANEALSLALTPCRISNAAEIRLMNGVVPKYIYHFGRKEILDRDLVLRTVPEQDWHDSIMSEKTNWNLPRFRRGLYGTERAFRADAFAHFKDPSFIRIEIRDECREARFQATTIDLLSDPRFIKWLGEGGREEFKAECVDSQGRALVRNYGKLDPKLENSCLESCEARIDSYLDAIGARVVQDAAVDASWYIRDRKCVARIDGTDAEMIRFFSEPDFFSEDRCGPSTQNFSTFRVFIRTVLRAQRSPSDPILLKSVNNWLSAKLPIPETAKWIRSFFSAYERCFKAGRLGVLSDAYQDFDSELSGVSLYEYSHRVSDGELNPSFDALCI